MKLLMITGDRALAQGKKGAFYYTLEEFAEIKDFGLSIGFQWVESGPLVRSSYHAAEQVRALGARVLLVKPVKFDDLEAVLKKIGLI